MVIPCNHCAFGTVDYTFAGLLVEIDFSSVRIDRTRTTVRIEEELPFRDVVVGAATVMLDCRKTYLPGKLVIRAVGQGVFYAPLTDCLPFDFEGALQGFDSLLADRYTCSFSHLLDFIRYLCAYFPNGISYERCYPNNDCRLQVCH